MNYPTYMQYLWRRGFTLVELLVVIAILGILSSVVIINYGDARALARDEVRAAQVDQIKLALSMYRAEHGEYPDMNGRVCTDPEQCDDDDLSNSISTALAPYVGEGIADPRQSQTNNYWYYYHGDRQCTNDLDAVTVHVRQAETERYQNTTEVFDEFCSQSTLETTGGGIQEGVAYVVFIDFFSDD